MSDSQWSIAVRTVGGKHVGHDALNQDFSVTVSPDDALHCLHHEIEHATGLKTSQQRLIYRGRLISNGDDDDDSEKREPRIRDVKGLADGQTIHLVPKRENETEREGNNDENSSRSINEDNVASSSASDSVGRSLLATLLGLGGLDDDGDASEDVTSSPSMRRLRASRNRRRSSHRLTQEDTEVPDPGSMEPVRQGLLTLHTLLDASQTEHPWDASRQWYRGQWVDCRDTVNQWLEATIVDIAHPDDLLNERTLSNSNLRRTTRQPSSDDAVSANDYEGRRNLLLEPDGEGGYCERQNNHGVHLLLIHYNGWPHRWDEWIRSDSERLRPFRTRTRHNPSSGSLPAPQTVFDGAPSTNIKEEEDEGDRAALLPELGRTMSSVNDLLQDVVASSRDGEQSSDASRPNSDLPWLTDVDEFPSIFSSETRPRYDRRQLEALVPLMDRLGRALTDAAPHVASLASTLPYDDEAFPALSTTDPENNVVIVGETVEEQPEPASNGFFSLLSRGSDNRSRTSNPVRVENEDLPVAESVDDDESDTMNPDYVDFVNGRVNTTRGDTRSGRRGSSDDGASLLGAYLALSSLASDVESNNSNSGSNGGGGLLGRLLRERGNNNNDNDSGGPAIDIHIHAIVTGPGVGPGAVTMIGTPTPPPPLTNTNTTTNSNSGRGLFSSRRGGGGSSEAQRVATPAVDEDDMGIFADLYSENPSPLNPTDSNISTDADSQVASPTRTRDEEAAEDHRMASNGHSVHGSPSRASRASPSRSMRRTSRRRNRSSPRRSGSIGRVLRNVLGQSRRRNNDNSRDQDAESL